MLDVCTWWGIAFVFIGGFALGYSFDKLVQWWLDRPRLSATQEPVFSFGPARVPEPPHAPAWRRRMTQLVGIVGGEAEFERSSVQGHVRWRRQGCRFYYYEQEAGSEWWGIVSLRHPKADLPPFLVRRRGGPCPYPVPPLVCLAATGLADFDERMEIRVTTDARLDDLPLGRESCSRFLSLASLLASPPVLDAHHSRARLSLQGVVSGEDDCRRVLEESCRLLEGLVAERTSLEGEAGMEYVDVLVPPESAPVCKVCGEAIVAVRVECSRCGTPHHAECWRYAGRCAVFACGGLEHRPGGMMPA